MKAPLELSRRDFLRVAASSGAGLLIGISLPGCGSKPEPTAAPTQGAAATKTPEPTMTLERTQAPERTAVPEPTVALEPTALPSPTAVAEPSTWLEPNIYLSIDNTGQVTIKAFRSEMGQGIRTAIAMILAEELDADWSAIRIEQSPTDRAYGDQVTGGSVSVSRHFWYLRAAGAAARKMLVTAAAQTWGVEASDCYTENGWVIRRDGDQRLAYGDLVEAAATLPVPDMTDLTLKEPEDFRIIGTGMGHWDAPRIVDGSAIYGSDVTLPGMLYATIARCPVFGGSVAGFDATQAKAVPGVRDAVQIASGVAVVAESTWAALQGREALEVTWDEGANAGLSSAAVREGLSGRLPQQEGSEGRLAAVYEVPYLAHATMEPMTCVADVRADRCEVWAPTQSPQEAEQAARRITGLPADAVEVHVTLIGGGFGRRLQVDYVEQAVAISQAAGAPVKLFWTRKDDMQHDFYHPLSLNRASVALDRPDSVGVLPSSAGRGVPTGAWRSVGNFPEAYAHECCVDEVAAALGRDPYELRREILPDLERAVLELAASKADWGSPLPDGWGRGIAFHSTFDTTPVAQVAEVSVDSNGGVRVQRVVCAVDCGRVINPDTVAAQMEGGIAFGLTAALKAAVTVRNGRVEQSNFHDYPLLRIDEMPAIEVYVAPSDRDPSGVGEMGVPPTVPAVLNALYSATGRRLRRIPVRPEDLV
jgi:isoquinoline 1-oxidoreductase beta subunit